MALLGLILSLLFLRNSTIMILVCYLLEIMFIYPLELLSSINWGSKTLFVSDSWLSLVLTLVSDANWCKECRILFAKFGFPGWNVLFGDGETISRELPLDGLLSIHVGLMLGIDNTWPPRNSLSFRMNSIFFDWGRTVLNACAHYWVHSCIRILTVSVRLIRNQLWMHQWRTTQRSWGCQTCFLERFLGCFLSNKISRKTARPW